MFKRSFFSAIILTAIGISSALLILEGPAESSYTPQDPDPALRPMLSMASLSLGNPSETRLKQHTKPMPQVPVLSVTRVKLPPAIMTRSHKIKNGDNLAGLLARAGIKGNESHNLINAFSKVYSPKRLRPGHRFDFKFVMLPSNEQTPHPEGQFRSVSFDPDVTRTIQITRTLTGAFEGQEIKKNLTRKLAKTSGTITSSLYVAGKKAGLSNDILAEMIRAYSWDVDFQRDIRKNDSFQIMFEKVLTDDGTYVKGGNILYATLTLSGKPHNIYRHTTPDGHTNYYDQNGHSARKALMRTPIDGARLSSGFGRRKHPVLGYTKMHKGVDFAASPGTPIYAAGNGTITYAGRKGSYGIYVRIRHNSEYSTAYAHMKGLSKKSRSGKRVNQGDVIGYVGTTGRSTGPHLHYEILKSGRQTNPLRVKMPSGKRLKGKELAEFQKRRQVVDKKFASTASEISVASLPK